MIAGLALTAIGCIVLWWRARSLSYPIVLRPTIFRVTLLPTITMLLGLASIAFGLIAVSRRNLFLALGIAIILSLHQSVRLSRNTIRRRIDRAFRGYNEIRLANLIRQHHNQAPFDQTEMLRETAASYAKRQGWPPFKVDSFLVSFIDTDGLAKITNIKDLAYALLVFEAREERMDEWSERHFPLQGPNWKYLNERYERFNDVVSSPDGAT